MGTEPINVEAHVIESMATLAEAFGGEMEVDEEVVTVSLPVELGDEE